MRYSKGSLVKMTKMIADMSTPHGVAGEAIWVRILSRWKGCGKADGSFSCTICHPLEWPAVRRTNVSLGQREQISQLLDFVPWCCCGALRQVLQLSAIGEFVQERGAFLGSRAREWPLCGQLALPPHCSLSPDTEERPTVGSIWRNGIDPRSAFADVLNHISSDVATLCYTSKRSSLLLINLTVRSHA